MIKKVVIAAAGQGTRMLHLTKNKSKHLIRVNQYPFLKYVLDNLFLAGYRELILVVGYGSLLIKEFIDKYRPPLKTKKTKYKITIINQYEILGPKEKEYGTACPLKCAKEFVGKENFLFICGDNLYSVNTLKKMNINDGYSYVAGFSHKHPEKYGVILSEKGFLKEIVEKPKKYIGSIINSGLYKFTPAIFDKVFKIKKSKRGEYEITDAINLLAKEKKVKVKEIKDYWFDFGNPIDIVKLSHFLKEKS